MATQLKDMKLSDFAIKGEEGCDGATFILCDGDKVQSACGSDIISVECSNPWYDNAWTFHGVATRAICAYCAESTCYAYSASYVGFADCAGSAYFASCAGSACYAGYAYELYADGCSHCIQSICYSCLSSLPGCARILYYT